MINLSERCLPGKILDMSETGHAIWFSKNHCYDNNTAHWISMTALHPLTGECRVSGEPSGSERLGLKAALPLSSCVHWANSKSQFLHV